MKNLKKSSIVTAFSLSFVLALIGPTTAFAATTPSLGTAGTFGLLSNLFQDNATTTITGVVGNLLGVLGYSSIAGAGGVITVNNGSTENSTAAWTAAGIAQGVAQTNLNNQYLSSCTDISSLTPAALEGVSINGGAAGTFPPGCYWSSGAMGITDNGIVTLSGAGTHLFRPGGALTTGAGSQVNLSGIGASACDVFWIPVAATTLGATSIFTGTDIDAAGITIGNNVDWSGRALAYGGTVTSNVALGPNTITVPTCTNPASLTVIKTVINSGGGNKVVADFPLFVDATSVTSGVLTNFSAGAYVITETTNSSYTQTFSGSCPGGNITLASGQDYTCTITNTYVPPATHSSSIASAPATLHVIKHVVNSGGGTATASSFAVHVKIPMVPVASDVIGSPAAGVEVPGTSYKLSVGTYTVSEDANASYTQSFSGDCDSSGSVTLSTGADKTCTITNTYQTVNSPTVTTTTTTITTPKLPNTGLPSQSRTPWDIFISAGILMLVSTSLVLALKKYNV